MIQIQDHFSRSFGPPLWVQLSPVDNPTFDWWASQCKTKRVYQQPSGLCNTRVKWMKMEFRSCRVIVCKGTMDDYLFYNSLCSLLLKPSITQEYASSLQQEGLIYNVDIHTPIKNWIQKNTGKKKQNRTEQTLHLGPLMYTLYFWCLSNNCYIHLTAPEWQEESGRGQMREDQSKKKLQGVQNHY